MTISEKIDHLEKDMEIFNTELKKLKEEYEKERENETTRFEPTDGDYYITINGDGKLDGLEWGMNPEWDCQRKIYNNVFKTKSHENLNSYVKNVIAVQNRLMQLHEELCPEHQPDWSNDQEIKVTLCFDEYANSWERVRLSTYNYCVVVFPSNVEHKALEILNKELE